MVFLSKFIPVMIIFTKNTFKKWFLTTINYNIFCMTINVSDNWKKLKVCDVLLAMFEVHCVFVL